MKREFGILIILLFSLNSIAQSENDVIIVVQKLYYDTLQTNYWKVKFEINNKADKVKRLDYSSAHMSDTIIVRETTEYKFENGHFFASDRNSSGPIPKIESYKVGDTIFERKADYLLKKMFSKNKITYIARLFPEQTIIPYNELRYIYSKDGDLIEIKEMYNSDIQKEYKTVFDYTDGIVSKITEFIKEEDKWLKEKVWEYNLITKNNLRRRTKKRINILLLDRQFIQTPW